MTSRVIKITLPYECSAVHKDTFEGDASYQQITTYYSARLCSCPLAHHPQEVGMKLSKSVDDVPEEDE